jgi:hypothetical protein
MPKKSIIYVVNKKEVVEVKEVTKVKRDVKLKEKSIEKEDNICTLSGCSTKKHGKFDECKVHFTERHRKGSQFKWRPAEVGYITIMAILKCYLHIYCINDITADNVDEGKDSKIPLSCLKCEYSWTPSIFNLINQGSSCPNCARKVPWTLKKFQNKMILRIEVNISGVRDEHIDNGKYSHVPVSCMKCKYDWNPTISGLVNHKSGCPNCSKKVPWSLERFQEKMLLKIKISIVKVREKHINKGVDSHVPVSCRECQYSWTPTIDDLINGEYGCPDCAGNAPYTLERFQDKMSNRLDVDINKVEEKHISEGVYSHVPVSCIECQYSWKPTIQNLINEGCGCPDCAGKAPWTLERFQDRMLSRPDVDISKVQEGHINGSRSPVPVSCVQYGHFWNPTISSLINNGSGCPKCKSSKAIKAITKYLDELDIEHKEEKTFKGLVYKSKLRIDVFISSYPKIKYPICIEYDGGFPGSHFNFQTSTDKESHLLTVRRDRIKDNFIIANKMHIIRIPYTCFVKNSIEMLHKTLEIAFNILKTKKKPFLYLADKKPYEIRDANLEKEE